MDDIERSIEAIVFSSRWWVAPFLLGFAVGLAALLSMRSAGKRNFAAQVQSEGDMNRIERGVEAIVFNSRWLVAPFLFGLIVGLAGLLYKFIVKLAEFVSQLKSAPSSEAIVGILNLVDFSLTANLILIVICSSYENFVRPINPAEHPNMPNGLIRIGFAVLKQKLLGSIVAITAVHALEWFMDIDQNANAAKLGWVVGIMIAFAVTMLVVAIADYMSSAGAQKNH